MQGLRSTFHLFLCMHLIICEILVLRLHFSFINWSFLNLNPCPISWSLGSYVLLHSWSVSIEYNIFIKKCWAVHPYIILPLTNERQRLTELLLPWVISMSFITVLPCEEDERVRVSLDSLWLSNSFSQEVRSVIQHEFRKPWSFPFSSSLKYLFIFYY